MLTSRGARGQAKGRVSAIEQGEAMRIFCLAIIALIAGAGFLSGTQNSQGGSNGSIIRGKVVFSGTVPRRAINMSSDPGCPQGPQFITEGWEDVIVYANPLAPLSHPIPSNAILLDRRECRFVPHTITMQVGQALRIRNSDATAHNTHAWATINMPFNLSLSRQGTETIQIFTQEEPRIPIRDDVHNWELANVAVFAHPYHTVLKLNGSYEFKLPKGAYQINVWSENLGTQSQLVEMKEGEVRDLDFTLK
jgi:plastocyanin